MWVGLVCLVGAVAILSEQLAMSKPELVWGAGSHIAEGSLSEHAL